MISEIAFHSIVEYVIYQIIDVFLLLINNNIYIHVTTDHQSLNFVSQKEIKGEKDAHSDDDDEQITLHIGNMNKQID